VLVEWESVWESVGECGRVWESVGECGECGRVWESVGVCGRVWECVRAWEGAHGRKQKQKKRVGACVLCNYE
jgi:hypothetical protein